MATSFKTISFQDHCVINCIQIKPYNNFFQDHPFLSIFLSRPLHLVYFQHNCIRTAHIPTAHVSLALRGPADSIQRMAGSYHTRIGSIQHSPRKMVCQHHRFPGHQRLQAMATPWHIQKGWQEEIPQKCVQGLCWHSRSLNIPMELHRWDVQWHQTGWTRNHWSARPMHQDSSWEVWLHVTGREDAMPIRATLPCHETLKSQEVGQITDSTEWNSHLRQTITTCQATRGNCQGLPMTQVQWRSCNGNHNKQDQDLQAKERSRPKSQR